MFEDDETLQMYVDESLDHLGKIENDLLSIEQNGADIDMAQINPVEFIDELKFCLGEKDTAIKIIVDDDSKMMLKLYQNKLTALGYKPALFNSPENVMPEILKDKPNLVITNLNMPNISGVELTREIRKKFTRNELPAIMITTQNDFIEDKEGDIKVNNTILEKPGINKILHKPFKDEDFSKVVNEFLG
jgi:FixJ family two-component response regulator